MLDQIDNETGRGSVECSASEVVQLMLIVQITLQGHIEISSEVYEILSESKLYNGTEGLDERIGEVVPTRELFSAERLESIEELIEFYISELPDSYRSIAEDALGN